MNTNTLRGMHPLIMVAAAAVILTCLLAIGVMTGFISSPINRADKQNLTDGTTSSTTTTLSSPTGTTRETTVTHTPEPRRLTASPAIPAPATGATSSSTSSTVAGGGAAPAAQACANCGTVTSVHAVKEQGTASMVGPAAGALLGGVLGNQVGHGTGRTIATVVGAGVGAGAGTEVERRYKSTTHYTVGVRMDDGSHRSFTYATEPNVVAGSKVKVVDGQLVHN